MSKKAPELKSFQKAYLRGLAHPLKPTVQVGQSGVTKEVLKAVDEALLAHELIKVRMMRPEDKKAMATQLAESTRSALCGLLGHTAILFRPHPEKPCIVVPNRKEMA